MNITLALKGATPATSSGRWLYLGDDIAFLTTITLALGAEQRVSIANEIPAAITRIRKPYLSWCAELAAANGYSFSWLSTHTAAKNNLVSPLFLQLCYLEIVEQLLRAGPANFPTLIIVEDWFLLRTVTALLKRYHHTTVHHDPWGLTRINRAARGAFRIATRTGYGIARFGAALLAARLTKPNSKTRPQTPHTPQVLLHTCTEANTFGADGRFNDRYFPGLESWFQSRGIETTVVPWLFTYQGSLLNSFRWLRKHKPSCFLLEDFLRWRDISAGLKTVFSSGWTARGRHFFEKNEITWLLWRERLSNFSATSTLRFVLTPRALERWLKAGNRVDVFIDMFENMPPERGWIQGFRNHSPATHLVGYAQVCSIPRDLLFYAIDPEEWCRGIYPDTIVTNSTIAAENLSAGGFPADHIAVGPALRHRSFLRLATTATPTVVPIRTLLFLLPIERNAAIELILLMLQLLPQAGASGLNIVCKLHPMMAKTKVLAPLGRTEFPDDITISTQPVDALLTPETLVFGFQSVLLDAAARETPFIIVNRELGLTLNPFTCWEDRFSICRGVSAELVGAELAQRMLRFTIPEVRQELHELAKLIRQGFGPIEDSYFEQFLPPRLRHPGTSAVAGNDLIRKG